MENLVVPIENIQIKRTKTKLYFVNSKKQSTFAMEKEDRITVNSNDFFIDISYCLGTSK